ncbi:glutaredoxin [Rhodotorula paludigena]|uniref:glutaredoxin n=1 Tax=Rhodotorula paludigena TaxID=86838 RepID=UPI00316C0C37
MSAKSTVDAKIAQGKRTVVFSKSYCPYCRRAKQLLKDANEDFDVYELDEFDEGADWQNALAEKTGQRTVPSIWIGGQFIGGCSDLEAHQRSGKLKQLLA